jgi:hypothetical protein
MFRARLSVILELCNPSRRYRSWIVRVIFIIFVLIVMHVGERMSESLPLFGILLAWAAHVHIQQQLQDEQHCQCYSSWEHARPKL